MARYVSDVLRIMRLKISRRNPNDPDSSDATLMSYIQDFIALTMGDQVRMFEQFSTLKFEIDETNPTGTYRFNDVGATDEFVTLSSEAFISLTNPPTGSLSWQPLQIFQDPGQFYWYWGVDNYDVLTRGNPTQMLYYGQEMVFRTLPNTGYTVTIFGYKKQPEFDTEGNPVLPQEKWLRFLAYGAAYLYSKDYEFNQDTKREIERDYYQMKTDRLTDTHNQIKSTRGFPSF